MKLLPLLLLFLFSCGSTAPIVDPIVSSGGSGHITLPPMDVENQVYLNDTVWSHIYVRDTVMTYDTATFITHTNYIDCAQFGVSPFNVDNADAFDRASNYVINNPGVGSNLYMRPGEYYTSRPWIWSKIVGGKWAFFNLRLFGDASGKAGVAGYATNIHFTNTTGFGIGVQFGRGIVVENIGIYGKYQFPQYINNYNIATTFYSAWNDGSVEDGRNDPYAGFVVDPFCDSNAIASISRYKTMGDKYLPATGRGGTSALKLDNVGIHNFMVGVSVSPNGYTQNAEMLNFIDNCIDNVKIAFAFGQDQSKEIHIERFKCWASTYTVVDGLMYGSGGAPCSVMIDGMNIAGNVNQLFNLNAGRFPLHAENIYSESLFRIGYVYSAAGVNINNMQVDLLTGPGMPEPDYIFAGGGGGTFRGGMLRHYDSDKNHRMNLSQMDCKFADMTLSNAPMVIGLYAYGVNGHPTPTFDNIHLFYQNTPLKADFEGIVAFPYVPVFTINTNWTGHFMRPAAFPLTVGDYIMASPNSTNGHAYDVSNYSGSLSTIQIGRVVSIIGDSVNIDKVSLNATSGNGYGAIYRDFVK